MSALLLETGVRLLGYRPASYLRQFSEFHPTLGWMKTPFAEGYFQKGDVRIHEKLNSKGLRSPEYDYARQPGTFRVLFLGDSFTEGYDVEAEDLFTTIIEKELHSQLGSESNVEVINAGTGGYSTDQEYLFYKTEGYRYEPDVVVLMFYAVNDVYYLLKENYGNYPKPRFELTDSGAVVVNLPLQEPHKVEGVKNLLRQLAFYQFALNKVLPQTPALTRWLTSLGLISTETAELATIEKSAPAWFRVFERNPSDEIQTAWQLADSMIVLLHRKVQEQNASLIVFAVPDRFQVYDESWSQTRENFGVNDSLWDRTIPGARLGGLCHGLGVPFIHFSDSLKAIGDRDNLYNGVHWNVHGNEIVAKILGRAILQQFITRNKLR